MFYSKTTGAFYDSAIHGDKIPSDAVEIDYDFYQTLLTARSEGKVIVPDENGWPTLIDPPASEPLVPQIVTMRQARLALLGAGLLAQVEAAIDALPEPQRSAARIEWDYSSEVHRSRAFVQQLGAALGLTDQQLDDLFTQAAAL